MVIRLEAACGEGPFHMGLSRTAEQARKRGVGRPGEALGLYLEPWMPAGASEQRHACPFGLTRKRRQTQATGGGVGHDQRQGKGGPWGSGCGLCCVLPHGVCPWAECTGQQIPRPSPRTAGWRRCGRLQGTGSEGAARVVRRLSCASWSRGVVMPVLGHPRQEF